MLKNIISIIIFLLSYNTLLAQNSKDSTFIKEYFYNGKLEIYYTKFLQNGEILAVGGVNTSKNSTEESGLVAKFSNSGKLIWANAIPLYKHVFYKGVIEMNNHDFLLYGTSSLDGVNRRVLFTKISLAGSLAWNRELATGTDGQDSLSAIAQDDDGTIVGLYNSKKSNQVYSNLFKMNLGGDILWSKTLNANNANCLFNTLTITKEKIFIGGYYIDGILKRALISTINKNNGEVIMSENHYLVNNFSNQDIVYLESKNDTLKYSVRNYDAYELNTILVAQMNANNDIVYHTTKIGLGGLYRQIKQTPSGGFMLLDSTEGWSVVKYNKFNSSLWTKQLSINQNKDQQNFNFDITPTEGLVSAGFSNFSNTSTKVTIIKTNSYGNVNDCVLNAPGYYLDTAWDNIKKLDIVFAMTIDLHINELVVNDVIPISFTVSDICSANYSIKNENLPTGCLNSFRSNFSSNENLSIYDFAATDDGGKIGVGMMGANGMVYKIKSNGEVEWSKQMDVFFQQHLFYRILKNNDNTYNIFASGYYVINHQVDKDVKIIRIDSFGNILTTKYLKHPNYSDDFQVNDVSSTPDGGFILLLNNSFGHPPITNYVIRLDKALNIVWYKQLKSEIVDLAHLYRSIYCNSNGIWLGYDEYSDYHTDKIGVIKLDYETGESIWAKRLQFENCYLRFNRIFTINDTVYAFADRMDLPAKKMNVCMLKFVDDGTLQESYSLNTDPLSTTYISEFENNYVNVVHSTISLSQDNTFFMANPTQINGLKLLNLTKFKTNGQHEWSKSYNFSDEYYPRNVHTQGTGNVIVGTIDKNGSNRVNRDIFMLKVDNHGELSSSPSGCQYENKTMTIEKIFPKYIDYWKDYSSTPPNFVIRDTQMLAMDQNIFTSLFCSEMNNSNCTNNQLTNNQIGCSLSDTISLVLNQSCSVSNIKWEFNNEDFTKISSSINTLNLIPKHKGKSNVSITAEGDCSISQLNVPVTISFSAKTLSLGNDTTLCGSAPIKLSAGNDFKNYVWSDQSNDSTLQILNPGTYYVNVTDYCNDISSDTIVISDIDKVMKINSLSDICLGDTAVLQATEGFSNYKWIPSTKDAEIEKNVMKIVPTQSMQYSVSAEVFKGCELKDSILISLKNTPKVNIGDDTIICNGSNLLLTAEYGFENYIWDNGYEGQTRLINVPGRYVVKALFSNGCLAKGTISVSNFPITHSNMLHDTSVCNGESIVLNPGTFSKYNWNNNSTNNIITANKPGLYWVELEDAYGCKSTDSTNIIFKDCASYFYLPTAFSPNNDGKNDIFRPTYKGSLKKYSISIYNRWGQLIFSSNNPSNGWSGMFNNKAADIGVYVWICNYQLENQSGIQSKGTVTLLR